jgi:2-methylcitrate dehydratase PrpD
VHGAAEGLVGLVKEHRLDPAGIERVRVQTYAGPFALDNATDPPSIYHAQYSYPFALAVAAYHGLDGLRPLTEATLGDPKLVSFAERVELELDADFEAAFPNERRVRVLVETASGTFTCQVDQEHNPDSDAAVAGKLAAMTRDLLTPGRQTRLIHAVLEGYEAPILFDELSEPIATNSCPDDGAAAPFRV